MFIKLSGNDECQIDTSQIEAFYKADLEQDVIKKTDDVCFMKILLKSNHSLSASYKSEEDRDRDYQKIVDCIFYKGEDNERANPKQ